MWRAVLFLGVCCLAIAQDSEWVVDKMAGGMRYASAAAWSPDGFLLFADLPAGKLTRIDTKGTSVWKDSIFAAGIAWDAEGRLYLCDPRNRRVTRTDKKGKTEVLAEQFDGRRLNGPNGVAVSKNHHVWFTDPAFGTAVQRKELDFYGIYHISPKGELEAAVKMAGRPNGIAFSPDGKQLYVVESDSRNILVWDVDRNGALSGQKVLAHASSGVPNGIAVDSEGKLYIAARRIEMFTPSGTAAGQIEISEKPSDLTWGDGDLKTLYVAAQTSVYRVRFKSKGGKTD